MEYIGLFKKLTSSWIFADPIILKVWIYFLCEASNKVCDVTVNNKIVTLQVGQLASGRGHLMKRLSLTERQARGAVDKLINNKVITLKVSSTYSIVNVLKYSHYQSLIKKNKIDKVQLPIEKPARTNDFDKWWASYPKKQGKFIATTAWKRLNPSIELTKLIMKKMVLFKQSPEWKQDDGKYIPMPSTWLNQKRWEDDFDEPSKRTTLEESL